MRRRAIFAVIAYAVLLGALTTPLFDATYERWSLPLVTALAATAAMGAAVRGWRALLVAVAAVAVLATDSGSQAILVLVFATPVLLVLASVGSLAGRLTGSLASVALFVLALVPVGMAASAWLQRGEHVSPSLQAALPVRDSLNQMCPEASSPPEYRSRLRMMAETLIREARRRPNALVTFTFYYSDDPEETRDITIRQLVGETLGEERCMPLSLWRRLQAVA